MPIILRNKFLTIILPLIFSGFSALKFNQLIYVELVICIYFLIFGTDKISKILPSLIAIYANFFAPMDNIERFGGTYPSIHTLGILGIKGIDILTVALAIYTVFKFKYKISTSRYSLILLTSSAFLLLALISTLVSFGYSQANIDTSAILYSLRGLLLFTSLIFIIRDLQNEDIELAAISGINTCIILMIAATIFTNENSLTRDFFGFQITTAFAGDEYNTIGVLAAAILISNKVNKNSRVNLICFYFLTALALALLSGRKSAIGYFLFCFILIYSHHKNKQSNYKFNLILLGEHFIPAIVIFFIINSDVLLLKLAFFESIGIFEPTIKSVLLALHSNDFSQFVGIGPFTKYQLIGLNEIYDHPFSFGQDANELFKFKVWFFPYERLFLNFGLAGIIVASVYLLRTLKSKPADAYIKYYLLYLISFNLTSTILVTSLAIGVAAIMKNKK